MVSEQEQEALVYYGRIADLSEGTLSPEHARDIADWLAEVVRKARDEVVRDLPYDEPVRLALADALHSVGLPLIRSDKIGAALSAALAGHAGTDQ